MYTGEMEFVEIYWESKWASEASGIMRFSKVRKMANHLHRPIERRARLMKGRGKTAEKGRKGKHNVERGQGVR